MGDERTGLDFLDCLERGPLSRADDHEGMQ
jgi:hypothetical protein